jgi:hypothetical protein
MVKELIKSNQNNKNIFKINVKYNTYGIDSYCLICYSYLVGDIFILCLPTKK